MAGYAVSKTNRVKQAPARGHYDRTVVHGILDEGWVAHVGFAHDGAQVVVPMYYVRDGERVLLHGSRKSRLFKLLAGGAPLALCVTLLDGLVLARSGFHHSMNYRSVVVHGVAQELKGGDRPRALDLFVERMAKGRAAQVRPMNRQEDKATMVLAVPIETVAAKIRSGPPKDDEEDLGWPLWAGVVPVALQYGAPEPDAGVPEGLKTPTVST